MRLSIYAVLYGGPMLEDIETGELVNPPELEDFGDLEDKFSWLTEARLLCDPDDEFGNLLPNYAERLIHQLPGYDNLPNTRDVWPRSQASDIEVHISEASKGLKFLRVDPDGSRQRISLHLDEGYTFDDRIYAAVYAECLDIAERVFASSTLSHVRDLRGLWTALRWRQSITSKCSGSSGYFPQANYTLSRNDYHVPQSTVAGEPTWEEEDFSGLHWPGPYPSTLSTLYYTLTSSPLEIEQLTSCLLQNLRAFRSKVTRTNKGTTLTDNLSKLPTEILDNILAPMGRDMPPESSHLLPQRLWKDQLKVGSRGLLPCLWDIDPACVDAKDSELCPGGRSLVLGQDWKYFGPSDFASLSEFGYSDIPTNEGHPMFLKRLGGGVYMRRGKARPQYWQRCGVEKKHGNETDETEQQGDAETPPATVEEIYAVLRKLGYPV
ncbi:hypothetical protein CCUS01_02430 [Colletotrichum cuscutae]|uniref:Uncharacterized protein n=1 Tax=Colletotrichum cuscutae TaxID=1209917 RepID=A0AAI9TW11_9PEZI|nr:hypothetical protein CCUS01_02430 [Colletotrichum cuscutae]